ncbi:hypothetical protein M422DRAFT_257621 [Sphaerobolus stellatus SS14]|uniref:Uncharacterized protein n=1 Tax=Sphaerobolus stellatus (strain SS14) TaxID=990650 RepID=A0A0C9UXF1_SPHS4|nr:hypothetical protein M422DRAFT_257621 [Sphaerobolus stellatus SS14]
MVMVQGRRLENLRCKQPIGIADQARSSSAASALFSLPVTTGTERLVVDLGFSPYHSMSSLPSIFKMSGISIAAVAFQGAPHAELKASCPLHHARSTFDWDHLSDRYDRKIGKVPMWIGTIG